MPSLDELRIAWERAMWARILVCQALASGVTQERADEAVRASHTERAAWDAYMAAALSAEGDNAQR